jgi:predicted CDS pa_6_350
MKWLLAVFIPPLAVLIAGGGMKHFAINIFLCMLAWVPGVIHAFYVCHQSD